VNVKDGNIVTKIESQSATIEC